jgi:hypothetical protein
VGSLTPHNPIALQGLLRDSFTLLIKNYLCKEERGLKIQLKTPKVTGNEEINGVVWEWFTNARSKKQPYGPK